MHMGVYDGVLSCTDIFNVCSLFWMTGFGENPDFPIAGYTWFIRDLFMFALFSPIYFYCYKKRGLTLFILIVMLVLSAFKNWHQPGMNTYLFLGGLFAFKGKSLEEAIDKISWFVVVILFLAINWLYYMVLNIDFVRLFLIVIAGLFIIKLSFALTRFQSISSFSTISMFLYVVHILVLNISRHTIIKFIHVKCDTDMCMYYFANTIISLVICIISYYFLKFIKANRLLEVITGGRS